MSARRDATGGRGRIVVLCPHFVPDNAPTGTVMTRIVDELVELGWTIDVVTSLPWYRTHSIEAGWDGRLVRRETTEWGSIRRVHPFPGDDKRDLLRRALGFVGFTALALVEGLRAGGWFRRVDAVVAMSPPLTLGLAGRIVALGHRAPLVFNIQDVFPDAAVRTGAITNRWVIRALSLLERVSYRTSTAVTVLSDDLARNVRAKLPARAAGRVHTIPNFVDTDAIRPTDRRTVRRDELGIGPEPVVMYAGNVGFSQSIGLLVDAAEALPEVVIVIHGDGAARADLERDVAARGLTNVRFAGYIEAERLGELLATADVHVVPLRTGLGAVSVPSKTYSVMAAARPVVAAIDLDSVVPRILAESGGGVAVAPDDADALVAALAGLLADPTGAVEMGVRGRTWVEKKASPRAVGRAYDDLIRGLRRDTAGRQGSAFEHR
ncbi:MAG: glycosyltransferase family 4 protein [Actinomycetota bacterium]